jgi:hypothetical protein
MEVYFHTFVALVLGGGGGESSASHTNCFTHVKIHRHPLIEDSLGPRSSLDAKEKRKSLAPARNQTQFLFLLNCNWVPILTQLSLSVRHFSYRRIGRRSMCRQFSCGMIIRQCSICCILYRRGYVNMSTYEKEGFFFSFIPIHLSFFWLHTIPFKLTVSWCC